MHNRLIFRYRCARDHAELGLLRGCSFGNEPTHLKEASDAGTQEGK